MSLEELKGSMLVVGPEEGYPNWDSGWRMKLVENLGVMVAQLRRVGIKEIFVDGSFVEDKDHPNDIDGYFECDPVQFVRGQLQQLNQLDRHGIWTWNDASRRLDPNSMKYQLPMWHQYRVELFPHYGQLCGILDQFGNELEFPAAFRR